MFSFEVLLIDLLPFEMLPCLQSFNVEIGATYIQYTVLVHTYMLGGGGGVEPTFNSSPVCLMFMQTFFKGEISRREEKSHEKSR